jgi:asparagine synthase (glutamine-hydrolysing)
MAGIAGLLDLPARSEAQTHAAIAAMTRAMAHRGPDGEGLNILFVGERRLALGQRHLAVQDVSDRSRQPMVHPETGAPLVFNGEIYNVAALRDQLVSLGHRLVGKSDTEVLLHGLARWGGDYLRHVQGMFALAFYDPRDRTLLLARDPMGIKPLYVAEAGGRLLFASEVRAILASGLVSDELDPAGVASLLAYGAVQRPMTMFRSIRSFPPGCKQTFDADGRSRFGPVPFWRYPSPDGSITEEFAVERLRTLTDLAVREHLVGELPVGLFLSSGIDSTIIAALAARHAPGMRSFTIGFADQPDMSEMALARETAQSFGLSHTAINVTGAEAERSTVGWLDALDQPSFDGINVFLTSQSMRANGIQVALSGLGGDELFGGYPSFDDVRRLRHVTGLVHRFPRSTRRALCATASVGRSEAVRHKLLDVLSTDGSLTELFLQRRRAMSDAQLALLGMRAPNLGLAHSFQRAGELSALPLDTGDVTHAVSVLESVVYQGNMLLRDVDANGMANGVEVRMPLLDRRLIDFVHRIPGGVRLPRGRADKHLLRSAFSSELRPAVLYQRKRAFTLPVRRWMLGPLRPLCEGAIAELKRHAFVRSSGIDAVWSSFLAAPESPTWSRAFVLVVLGYYLRRSREAGSSRVDGSPASDVSPVTSPSA